MKYGWRRGKTTYSEDRRFEGTVIFDDRIKPNFVKVKTCVFLKKNWHGAHRCLVNAVLALLNHIQHRHIFWTFPLIHFSHKSPSEIINSFQNHTKKTIPKTHQTSVSVAPNALEPLNYLASPCSFGCPNMDLHRPCSKIVILSRGFTVFFENAKKHIFKIDDTSN